MSTALSSHAYRVMWWASLPLLPVLAVQGQRVRDTVSKLPEADGPRQGRTEGAGGAELSVAVLGESTAAGVGAATQALGVASSLANVLAERRGGPVGWQAVGQTGATVDRVQHELVSKLSWPIDVVVVMVGANDTIRMTTEARWAHSVLRLSEELRQRGARSVVFAAVPPVGTFPALPRPLRDVLGVRAKLLDALLREVLLSADGVSYAQTEFPSGREYMASDGVHPSELGYSEWARQLGQHIVRLPLLRPAGPQAGFSTSDRFSSRDARPC